MGVRIPLPRPNGHGGRGARTWGDANVRKTELLRGIALALACSASMAAMAQGAPQPVDVPAGDLATAIETLRKQTGSQILFRADQLKGLRTQGVRGTLPAEEALERLLEGSGFRTQRDPSGAILITAPKQQQQPEPEARSRQAPATSKAGSDPVNMPTIMVTGARSLNMDITRTQDDPQPYVVFQREQIERSGATSIEQFLQERLTMNASEVNAGVSTTGSSQVRLRGLSASQTLILIDGHRASGPTLGGSIGDLGQVDLRGIPVSAVERIEVLPTTASGIYGGSATGGVINIILRRDFSGGELRATWDNTFDTDSAVRKVDLTYGHRFNRGKTTLMASASYSDANELLNRDRDLVQHGRDAVWRKNPAFFIGPTGAPPLGATPNISSLSGEDLVLDDGTSLHSPIASVPEGYAGVNTDGGAALVDNAGTYNWSLARSAQVNGGGNGGRQALFSQPKIESGTVVLRHEFTDRLQVFGDFSASRVLNRYTTSAVGAQYFVHRDLPNNPFQQDILVSVPLPGNDSKNTSLSEHQRAVLGLVQTLPHDWQLGIDYTWDRTTVDADQAPTAPAFGGVVATGSVDVLRDTNAYPIDVSPYLIQSLYTTPFRTTMEDSVVRASGPLGHWPGGAPTLTASLAYRHEAAPDTYLIRPSSNAFFYYPERAQTTSSAYLELRLPFWSEQNARPWLRALELQLAVRRDDYKSLSGPSLFLFGLPSDTPPETPRVENAAASVDPTIALRWQPTAALTLRASYGTGMIPPGLSELASRISPFPQFGLVDPLRGNTNTTVSSGPITAIVGGNSGLGPEQSTSWSAGLILAPVRFPGLRVSVDYTRIEKTDNIAVHPFGPQGILNDEARFPGRVVRGERLPTDPPGWAGPILSIDSSLLNLARADLEAWDARLDFSKNTDLHGIFDLFLAATWQPHFRTQTLDGQPFDELAGIGGGLPRFKANAGASWTIGPWRAGWNASHLDSYKITNNEFILDQLGDYGNQVASQTYHDVFVHYDFGLAGGRQHWWSSTELQLGIRNVFNRRPPVDPLTPNFYSLQGNPRLAMYWLSLITRF